MITDNRETTRQHLVDLIERLQAMDVRTIEEANLLGQTEDALRRFLDPAPYIIQNGER